MGIILTILLASGKTPWVKDWLHISESFREIVSTAVLINEVGMELGPVALDTSRLLMMSESS